MRVGVLGAGLIPRLPTSRRVAKRAISSFTHSVMPRRICSARWHRFFEPTKTFGDYDALLEDEKVDAVVVAIADQFHVAMAVKALKAGKHVLIEKPMGISVGECERLRDVAHAHPKLHVQVGTMRRFDPGVGFAHEFIRDEIGELLAFKAWYCDSIYRYQETDNLHPLIHSSPQVRRSSGNPKADKFPYYLLGQGRHLVDTARFLCGDILAVRAEYREKFGAHSWFVSVEFANGAHGHLDLTLPMRMEWHEGVGKSTNPWYFKSSEVECFSTRDGQYHRPLGPDGHTFRRQIEGFAAVVLKGAPAIGAGVEDGLAALRALSAISHSAKTGQRVALSEAPGNV